ncbi:MAG: IPT/TIG domain-containing protein [Sphingobacterium sp.]
MKTKFIHNATLFLFLISMASLGIFIGCKKNEVTQAVDYSPVSLKAGSFSNLEGKTVTLHGRIERLNGMPVEDHGFIIEKIENNKDSEKEILFSLGNKVTPGEVSFKYQYSRDFEVGDRFRYTLYVKTKNGFYRSESSIFEVDGLQINYLEDMLVPNNNKITVTGDFKFISENVKLYYDGLDQKEYIVPYQLASDRKSLIFTFPKSGSFNHGNKIFFFLRYKDKSGQEISRGIARIQILGTVNPPTKTQLYLSDYLPIEGTGLDPERIWMDPPLYILINGKKIKYKNYIYLLDIENLKGTRFQLGYHNGKDSVVFKDSIELIKPIGSNIHFEKKIIHSPYLMKMTGIDFYSYITVSEKAKYYLGKNDIAHIPYSTQGNTESFAVRNIPNGLYNFSYSNPFYTATTTEQVEVRNLTWVTPPITSRFVGEAFTITGNFIDDQEYLVSGDGIYEHPIAQDGKINFTLPSNIIGQTEIQIGYRVNINYDESFYAPKKQSLYINDFQVSDITPLKGYPGDVITIKGKGLGSIQITVGGTYATSIYRSSEEHRFIIPAFASKGKSALVMTLNGTTIKHKELFEVL